MIARRCSFRFATLWSEHSAFAPVLIRRSRIFLRLRAKEHAVVAAMFRPTLLDDGRQRVHLDQNGGVFGWIA